MNCVDIPAPLYLIFSSSTPHLLYYSHIPTVIVALILGFYVWNKNKGVKAAQLLLLMTIMFGVWSFLDLILWTNIDSRLIMFYWSLINFVEVLLGFITLYFTYVFLEKKDVEFKFKLFFLALLVPFVLFVPTKLNLTGFDLSLCEAIQGPLVNYYYFVEAFLFIFTFSYLIMRISKSPKEERRMIVLFSCGVLAFLLSFTGANILGSLTENWLILQYGLFGMVVFIGFLAYLIVEYSVFNIKLVAAQAIMITLISLIASQFAFIQNSTNKILNGVTLLLSIIFGWQLIKSVKKEIEQKEELARINKELDRLDKAKNEFINIASHQLRTPITVIKGVVSMIQGGDMDKLDPETKKQFYDGAMMKCQKLEEIINDILNATSLTNKKFNVMDKAAEDINVKEFFEKMIEGFKPETLARNINLTIGKLDEAVPVVQGQKKYLEEAFSNLVTNAIKYTPSSKKTDGISMTRAGNARIEISSKKEGDYIIFSVKDNGIGIPPDEISHLFKKFYRAKNATEMYVDGTGLGLFIVKEIAEGHGGDAWAESQLGKGTEFFIKFPIKQIREVDVKKFIEAQASLRM